jgi:hypothetical protein
VAGGVFEAFRQRRRGGQCVSLKVH